MSRPTPPTRTSPARAPWLALLVAALGVLGMLATGHARASEPPADDPRAVLQAANAAYDRAIGLQDPADAAESYANAIAGYTDLIERGYDSVGLHRNLGNAALLAGDTGLAVLSFLRAQRLDPTDPYVRDSLAAARGLVRTEVRPALTARTTDAVLFWRGLVPRSRLLWAGVALWALGWSLLAGRAWATAPRLTPVAIACLTGSGLVFASLWLDWANGSARQRAVVMAAEAIGYRGSSEAIYEPTFTEPLRAGVEGEIAERSLGWVRLVLRDGTSTWVQNPLVSEVIVHDSRGKIRNSPQFLQ